MGLVNALEIEAGGRRIEGEGTPEAAWAAWPVVGHVAACGLDDLVDAKRRAVIVAPHPDDEVLGCGGAIAMLAAQGREVLLVGVTDGDASHPHSPHWTPASLAAQRRVESATGLQRLGVPAVSHRLTGVPDGAVARHETRVTAMLDAELRPDDVVFVTWRFDGHPDHEACGRAAARAAATSGCRLVEMPVWMWHWAAPGDARVPWQHLRRLDLDGDAQAAKRSALMAHRSQLESDDPQQAPVLPEWALARLLRPYETFLVTR